ncbi:NAD(P)H-dependent flavin oxidoreductase [Halalkalibacter alkalisediminis]|uniref:Probable nitronate monooxygenase n=1 Tax=Halalkalibacter alkalisediminis TaxID=935616 RepID=A0ABV6NMU4_9BACI|nr:nitronate monooxygenase [Halalkalibacter alkalisediminis]
MQNELTKQLGITYPLIQAPMAGGVTTTKLVAAVSSCGGLGMIGAGYLTPFQMREQIKQIQKATTKPFGVNLFVPSSIRTSEEEVREANQFLKPYLEKYNLQPETKPLLPTELAWEQFEQQLKVIVEEKVPICSFTFELPTDEQISLLKEHDVLLIGTATNVKEAMLSEQKGMDMVVVQGTEAGGHRGSFMDDSKSLIGLMSLIPQVVDRVQIPVIAAGGIMDGRGMSASLCLGAKGVQMGTAFLTCKESGAPEIHKKAILQALDDATVLTRSFSGKWARGLNNVFIEEMKAYEDQLPDFPIQNILTKQLRQVAAKENNMDFMSLWSGQSPLLAKDQSVGELISRTIAETKAIMHLK